MSETRFTMGPWRFKVDDWDFGAAVCAVYGTTSREHLNLESAREMRGWTEIISDGEYTEETQDANARLIAAAPTLYKALEMALEHMEWSTPQGAAAWDAGQLALARARGEA